MAQVSVFYHYELRGLDGVLHAKGDNLNDIMEIGQRIGKPAHLVGDMIWKSDRRGHWVLEESVPPLEINRVESKGDVP